MREPMLFYTTVPILLGGGLFGVVGMFLGVPAFACLYTAVRTYSAYRLKKKGLPTDTASYYPRKDTEPTPPAEEENKES